jgi:hypothetical protein
VIVPGLGDLRVLPCNNAPGNKVLNKKPANTHGYKEARPIEPPKDWGLVGVATGIQYDVLDIDPKASLGTNRTSTHCHEHGPTKLSVEAFIYYSNRRQD